MGHARALLSVENPTLQLKLYERIIKEGLSVRKVEELAKSMREEKPEKPQREDSTHDFDLLKNHLTAKFKTLWLLPVTATARAKLPSVSKMRMNLTD